jgi:DNA end-binding protein Ku
MRPIESPTRDSTLMPRAIWKGSLSFGLVEIPVALVPAEQTNELSLSMLDSRDHSPVGYKRINKNTGEEVPWEKIAKGYEYEKGEFIVLSEADLHRASPEATQTVDILAFVDEDEIDSMYYDTPYYLEPLKKGSKSYALLRETLRRTQKVGVAKLVLRTRQRLAAVTVRDKVLVVNLLRFARELREPSDLELPGKDGVGEKELKMAERLVGGMTEKWKPEKYHDEYRDELMAYIEKKARSGELEAIEEPKRKETARRGEVFDLMALLEKSVGAKGKAARKPARAMKAPRRRAAG